MEAEREVEGKVCGRGEERSREWWRGEVGGEVGGREGGRVEAVRRVWCAELIKSQEARNTQLLFARYTVETHFAQCCTNSQTRVLFPSSKILRGLWGLPSLRSGQEREAQQANILEGQCVKHHKSQTPPHAHSNIHRFPFRACLFSRVRCQCPFFMWRRSDHRKCASPEERQEQERHVESAQLVKFPWPRPGTSKRKRLGRRSSVELCTEALYKAVRSECDLSRVSAVCPLWWSQGEPLAPRIEEAAKESRVKTVDTQELEAGEDEEIADEKRDTDQHS